MKDKRQKKGWEMRQGLSYRKENFLERQLQAGITKYSVMNIE
jgi:hypothetical protein